MNKDYDVIVIGAGNGGLTAAAGSAKNGLKTLLVEKHNIPGGAATSFVRGRFEFEPSLHELALVGPAENPGPIRQMFDSLGAKIDWLCDMDETFRLLVPEEDIDAFMPCGVEAFAAAMEKHVPGSFESTLKFVQLGIESLKVAPMITDPSVTPEQIEEQFPDFFAMAGHTAKEGLDALGMPEKAQNILATYWVYLGGTMDVIDFYNYAKLTVVFILFGAGAAKGRSHEISLALDQVIRENGGEIWYNTEAEKILVKDGKAYGIAVGGKEYYSDYVVCNAYPDLAYGKMIDPSEVPERAVKLVNSRQLAIKFVTVYLGMNKTAEELGIDVYSTFISDTSDDNKQFDQCNNTKDYPNYVICNCLNLINPGCTPEGTSQLFLTICYYGNGWDDITADEYFKHKDKVALDAIKHVERAMNVTILPYIEEIEIASPVTFARYLNTPGGTPYGYQMTREDGFTQRWSALKEETFIDDLIFVGASAQDGDGFNVAYTNGLYAARSIVAAEMQKGGKVR